MWREFLPLYSSCEWMLWMKWVLLERNQNAARCHAWRAYFQWHTLHWRHNDHDGVSNHQPHGCLLNRLFRRRSKKTSKLRVTALCVGNSPGPVNSPHKGPVTRKMFPFDDVIMLRWPFSWGAISDLLYDLIMHSHTVWSSWPEGLSRKKTRAKAEVFVVTEARSTKIHLSVNKAREINQWTCNNRIWLAEVSSLLWPET